MNPKNFTAHENKHECYHGYWPVIDVGDVYENRWVQVDCVTRLESYGVDMSRRRSTVGVCARRVVSQRSQTDTALPADLLWKSGYVYLVQVLGEDVRYLVSEDDYLFVITA